MATVWAARHRNGKRVAIKLLHPEFTRDERVRHRFLREGYVANKVKHPAVVTILDDDDDGDLVFLVMELLEGETVGERWKRHDRRLPLGFVLRVADEVLDVLAAAHEQEVVHRDIKPANLFVTVAGEIKVLDFGIARLHEGPAGTGHTTRLGAHLGSPAYMSPEQARARWEFVDARTDLWALGAVMFSLLSGQSVHPADNAAEMLIATATQAPRPLHAVAPEVPDVVAAIVDRALAFERGDRWQDARAMQAAVRRARSIDFDAPRAPAMSLLDPSFVAPATSEVVIRMPSTRPGASSTAPPAPDPEAPADEATRLMPTWRPGGPSSAPPPDLEGPPPSGIPGTSTTSAPVAAPLEPAIPTIPAPPLRSLRPTVVLGSFIALGLLGAGVAIGLLSRRPPAVVVVPAASAPVEVASQAVPPAPAPPAPPPSATVVASVEASSVAPTATPSASAAAPGAKKKPGGTRSRPGRGRFDPGNL
jgi:serine/threonine-protein kinase